MPPRRLLRRKGTITRANPLVDLRLPASLPLVTVERLSHAEAQLQMPSDSITLCREALKACLRVHVEKEGYVRHKTIGDNLG